MSFLLCMWWMRKMKSRMGEKYSRDGQPAMTECQAYHAIWTGTHQATTGLTSQGGSWVPGVHMTYITCPPLHPFWWLKHGVVSGAIWGHPCSDTSEFQMKNCILHAKLILPFHKARSSHPPPRLEEEPGRGQRATPPLILPNTLQALGSHTTLPKPVWTLTPLISYQEKHDYSGRKK